MTNKVKAMKVYEAFIKSLRAYFKEGSSLAGLEGKAVCRILEDTGYVKLKKDCVYAITKTEKGDVLKKFIKNPELGEMLFMQEILAYLENKLEDGLFENLEDFGAAEDK